MAQRRSADLMVGLFMLVGILALVFLAFKVSGLTQWGNQAGYTISAEFDNIGGLKVRAPVKLAGVVIGEVTQISVDPKTFRALVSMRIEASQDTLPVDSSLSILTAGLLGSNYIGVTPGYDQQVLKQGSRVQTTHPALILENLIGQLLFKLKGNDGQKKE